MLRHAGTSSLRATRLSHQRADGKSPSIDLSVEVSSEVCLEAYIVRKLALAYSALEELLPGVGPQVYSQVACFTETLVAHSTLEGLLPDVST